MTAIVGAMRTAAQRSGDAAEELVAGELERLGWRVLARHVRVGRSEVDLIAIDPRPPSSIVLVEVRWRSSRAFGFAEETVDGRKWARLHRAGFALREAGRLPDGTPLPRLPLRFDLIVLEPGGRLRHHRAAA